MRARCPPAAAQDAALHENLSPRVSLTNWLLPDRDDATRRIIQQPFDLQKLTPPVMHVYCCVHLQVQMPVSYAGGWGTHWAIHPGPAYGYGWVALATDGQAFA
jgi:hypothetical protein